MGAQQSGDVAHRLSIERLRHIAWAAAIAMALHALTLIMPLDYMLRPVQHALSSSEASGRIAFIGAQADLADPDFPQRREQLAGLVTRLDAAGVEAVYVDIVFGEPSVAASDARLNEALRATAGRARLVKRMTTGVDGSFVLQPSSAAVGSEVNAVGSYVWTDFLGFAWQLNQSVPDGAARLPNLASALAGQELTEDRWYAVNYFYRPASVPTFRFEELARPGADLSRLAGHRVVVGLIDPPAMTRPNLPGLPSVPPSLIHIYGAETLASGRAVQLDGAMALTALALLLGCCAFIDAARRRRLAYAGVVLLLPLAYYAAAQAALRMDIAAALVFLVLMAGFRARAVWRRNVSLVDTDTGLPTFAALEADRDVADLVPAIIVARLHRFEEVRRTLPRDLHVAYVLRIVARLKASAPDLVVHTGQGHLLAWTLAEKDPLQLREHLEGLRALFASPLLVGDQQVDVGITFGVDITSSPNVTRRLAAAVSAAERTNEAFEPIAIAESASEEDLIWNISLQARIDAGLANGEIYLVYQPKIALADQRMIGVEALVRWQDPERGNIPPDRFIRQCENAGRMSHLTRHVLREACGAALRLEAKGRPIGMAVNISATLLHERTIVRMVQEVLEETGLDPARLTLEITETYRISNLDRACEILCDLSALGVAISMDDFGVGAASLEALLRLPFDELKIDRLFVAAATSDAKAAGIVRSMMQLGRDLRIKVVAEGVEDAATLALLRDAGCPVAQGYGLSRPVPLDVVIGFRPAEALGKLTNMV